MEETDDSSDILEGFDRAEEVWGTVQCFNGGCEYFGRMEGVILADDKKFINFVCPDCNTIEKVANPEHIG